MAQQTINVGTSPNDGQGDPIRTAFIKCNDNFTELFSGSGGANAISNGNSIVRINTANGNISMSVDGSSNVAVVTTTGINTGNVSVTGVISAGGNVTGGNLRTTGTISATGNIAGNYILGDGSLLTGITTNYSNANVAAYLPTYSGNITAGNVSVTGNITGNYILGNGSQLTGITVNYSNANVAAYLPTYSGNITANTISASGNVTANNFIGSGAGTPTLSSATNLDLSAATAVRVTGGGTFRLPSLTAAQIANLVAADGDMVYNTTSSKIQGYEGGSWGNLI